jgi:hypothetical protein
MCVLIRMIWRRRDILVNLAQTICPPNFRSAFEVPGRILMMALAHRRQAVGRGVVVAGVTPARRVVLASAVDIVITVLEK